MVAKYIILVLLQAASLAGGQAMFKLFLNRMKDIEGFQWNWYYVKQVTLEHGWILLLMTGFFGVAFFLWYYVLKEMDFSQAYPLSSLSFVFGMFLAYFLFPLETITFNRWIGVVLIVVGCFLISMK